MIRAGIRRLFTLSLRRRERWEREVDDEIRLHLLLRAEQLVGTGRSPDDARQEAIRRFGAGPLSDTRTQLLTAARHREEHMRRREYLGELRQDVHFSLRALRRQPAWAAVTILTLALGIGATTAVFGVVSSLLLHPIPYPDASRVVSVDQQPTAGNTTGISVSVLPSSRIVRAWRDGSHSFEALEGYLDQGDMWIGVAGSAQVSVKGARVLPGFVPFTGQRPLIGRVFNDDEARSHAHVALIGEELWRSRYAATARVLGQSLTIDDSAYTIIGVLPAAARLPHPGLPAPQIWLPLDLHDDQSGMAVVGRLRSGVTIPNAARELDSIAARANVAHPTHLQFTTRIISPADLVHYHDTLVMLMAAVALVLLVACANVAHLQLTRGAARARELAVRTALGAGRTRLMRQLMTESLVVTGLGAIAGMGVAWLALRGIVALRPAALTELDAARVDATTLVITALLTVGSGVAFGLIGLLQSSRWSTQDALKEGSLASSPGRTGKRLRFVLVVGEMALSATLLIGATLLVRSVIHLLRTDLGFDPQGLYAIQLDFPMGRYPSPARRASFQNDLFARTVALPGVQSVAVAHVGPDGRAFSIGTLEVEGEPPVPSATTSFIDENGVSPNFFSTLRIPILEGTTFTDTSAAANQVIVNAGFAHRHWKPGAAIGHRIRVAFQGQGAWKSIVGVVADASPSGPSTEATAPILYMPPAVQGSVALYVRADPTASIARQLQQIARSADPMLHPTIVSLTESTWRSTAAPRFIMGLLAAFALLAVILASIGLYGVMAYGVAQETREIGIRVALGATHRLIGRRVLARGFVIAGTGALAGVVASHWATKLIEEHLYGVTRSDFMSSAAAVATLLAASLLASIVPARRALAVDPMTAIRAE